MDAGMFVLGLVALVVVAVLGVVALVFGRGFKGEVGRGTLRVETEAERRR